ncbi:unnamed protein product [Lymnaea stagnalis]|uniref:Cadherin domain-containing protein n=1 Tax=Lymnaea stagnalis TaxID=6523 RepID=A0AAV2HFD3_LYMST
MEIKGQFRLLIFGVCFLISPTTAAVTINEFTQPTYVAEDPTVLTKLVEITVSDSGGATVTDCDVVASSPNGPFSVSPYSTEFWVVYDATSNLDYSTTNFYELTLECAASSVKSNRVKLFVYVTPNSPPVITAYPTATATLDASTFDVSTAAVYQVTATDAEKDTLTYSLLSQQPSQALFSIDSATGKITANRDLRLLSTSSYILTVQVSDGKNVISDFHVVVNINKLNTAPVILNLPTSINIPEDAVSGTTLIALSVEDNTAYPGPVKPTCTTSPSSDGYKFTLNADNTITLSASNLLNYEVRKTYTITCRATDGYLSTDGNDVLTVNVENVNEPPVFNSNPYYCTIAEGAQRDHYCTLSLTITDPEGDPLSSLDFEPASSDFYFDKSTNRIYFSVAYDVDVVHTTDPVSLILKAVDSGGATATASVIITVTDDNDQTCAFDKSTIYQSIDQNTALGALGAFIVTDEDLTSPNKDTKVEIVSSSPSNSGSYITVTGAGELYYIGSVPAANSGSSYTMVVKCKDGGTPARSAFATVIVSYTYITTTTTTTTTAATTITTTTKAPEKTIWDYDWFIAVFSIFMILLAAAVIGLIAYIVYKCCCQTPQRPNYPPRRKVNPEYQYDDRRITRSSYYDDDDYLRTSRSDYNYNRSWQSHQAISPRQIPALEYR